MNKNKTSSKYSIQYGGGHHHHHSILGTSTVGGHNLQSAVPGPTVPTKSSESSSSIIATNPQSGQSTINNQTLINVNQSSPSLNPPQGSLTNVPLSSASCTMSSVTSVMSKDKDSKTLIKLIDLSYLKDFYRLGLGSKRDIVNWTTSGSGHQRAGAMSSRSNLLNPDVHFRISAINCNYNLVRTYPTFLVIPSIVHDDSVRKLARGYRSNRLPAIVWRHPLKRGLLLRSASFHGKGLVSMLISSSSGQVSSVNPLSSDSMNVELAMYFRSIINLTPSHFLRKPESSRTNITSLREFKPSTLENLEHSSSSIKSCDASSSSPKHKNYASSTLKGMQKTFGNTLGKSSARGRFSNKHKVSNLIECSSGNAERAPANDRPATLHILGEKSLLKGIKSESSFASCSFIPLELHEEKQVKGSFKKLLRACCPSSLATDPDMSFYKTIK